MFHPEGPTFFELARQALSSTQRGYDLLAPKFDRTPFRTPDDLLQCVQPAIAADGEIEWGLDVCCGTGAGMRMLRPLCRRRLTGVDMSAGMLEVARRQSADWPGGAELEFLQRDVLDAPERTTNYDAAVCFGALGHILPRDQDRFLANVFAQLTPGGRFYFISGPLPPFWSRQRLMSRAFNFAMHIRNWLIRPPFIMYYLTFLLPGILDKLREHGFEADTRSGLFPAPLEDRQLVVARRPEA